MRIDLPGVGIVTADDEAGLVLVLAMVANDRPCYQSVCIAKRDVNSGSALLASLGHKRHLTSTVSILIYRGLLARFSAQTMQSNWNDGKII